MEGYSARSGGGSRTKTTSPTRTLASATSRTRRAQDGRLIQAKTAPARGRSCAVQFSSSGWAPGGVRAAVDGGRRSPYVVDGDGGRARIDRLAGGQLADRTDPFQHLRRLLLPALDQLVPDRIVVRGIEVQASVLRNPGEAGPLPESDPDLLHDAILRVCHGLLEKAPAEKPLPGIRKLIR